MRVGTNELGSLINDVGHGAILGGREMGLALAYLHRVCMAFVMVISWLGRVRGSFGRDGRVSETMADD